MGQSVQKLDDLENAIMDKDSALPRVIALLNSGESVDSRIRLKSALYFAIERDKTLIAELLLERGADVRLGYICEKPLHIAAARGNLCIVSKLVEKGAYLNPRNKHAHTPLWVAASEGHYNVVDLLLQQPGVDVNCHYDDTDQWRSFPVTSVLSQAVTKQHYNICELLLMSGVNVNRPDINSYTPLHHACHVGNVAIACLLIQHGSALNCTTKEGYTPLHTAITCDHADVVDVLVQAGCDVNFLCSDNSDFIPLHMAAKRGNPDIVAALCSSIGIQIDRKDLYSMTALIVACQSSSADCLKELHSGTSVKSLDSLSQQPLSLAVYLEEDPHFQWRLQHQQPKAKRKPFGDGDKEQCNGAELDRLSYRRENMDNRSTDHENAECSLIDNIICSVAQSVSTQKHFPHLEVLRLLISAGASLHIKDDFHKTAMEHAMNLYGFPSALMLLCHGAVVDIELLKSFLATNYLKPTCILQGFIFPLIMVLMWSSVECHRLFQSHYLKFPFHNIYDLPMSMKLALQQPMSLARHCRSVVRDALIKNSSGSISPLVQRLPVPRTLKQFLLLSDVLQLLLTTSQHGQAE